MKIIRPGDVIFFCSFDRLGRTYEETVERWRYITKKKKTNIVILDMPLLDTREKAVGEMGELVTDIVVQLMAYLSDAERKKNREAQKSGIDVKKARGEWNEYGRPRKVSKEKFKEVYKSVLTEQLSENELQESLGISRKTFLRYKKEWENSQNIIKQKFFEMAGNTGFPS